MKAKKMLAVLTVIIGLVGSLSPGAKAAESVKSHYWTLGVGSYGAGAGELDQWTGFTYLDRARMDWVFLTFGNPPGPSRETTEMLNRLLKINPRLKIMVRLWPIGGLGLRQNRYQATFLDYLYKEGVRERLLKEISRQIRSVLDYIDKPENVLGFTFLEELPFHFADNALDILDEDTLSWSLEHYREEIEAERGKPLKWDEDMRRWWGKRFVQVINEIHKHIKEESGGRWVFIWLQVNHPILDWFPEGVDVDLRQWRLLPFHFADIIKPGYADGFFAYPNNKYVWQRYLDLATKNNWLFFSQLSHPGGMRLTSWEEALRLAETKVPQNLGYFFYCMGNCYRGEWNDDPSIPSDDNFRRASVRSHHRRFLAQRNVGMDIVKKHLLPRLELAYDSEKAEVDSYVGVRALVRNIRDASWYLEEDTVLKNVKLKLELPPGYILEPAVSQPAQIEIGDLGANQYVSAIWWPKKTKPIVISETSPVSLTLTADNSPPVTITLTAPKSVIESVPTREVRKSGERWIYPAYHLPPGAQTTIIMESIGEPATNPSLTIGRKRIIWRGCLVKGQTLVLGPGRKAILKDSQSPEGRDVSDRLAGVPVRIGWGLNHITYTDENMPSPASKLRITIDVR